MRQTLFSFENTRQTPRIMAHRGFTPVAPENSLPAFRAAAARGFWAIETDIRRTRDGVLVCCYNPTTAAKYGIDLSISDETFATLQKATVTVGDPVATYTEEELKMPTLGQYLDICQGAGAVPFIESKEPIIEEIFAELRRRDLMGHAVLSSIDFSHIEEARRLDGDIFIHHIFSTPEQMLRLGEMGNAGLSYNYKDLSKVPKGLIEETHRHGVRLCLRAGDTVETCLQMLALGLDYIPSNKIYTLTGAND